MVDGVVAGCGQRPDPSPLSIGQAANQEEPLLGSGRIVARRNLRGGHMELAQPDRRVVRVQRHGDILPEWRNVRLSRAVTRRLEAIVRRRLGSERRRGRSARPLSCLPFSRPHARHRVCMRREPTGRETTRRRSPEARHRLRQDIALREPASSAVASSSAPPHESVLPMLGVRPIGSHNNRWL